MKLAIIPHSDEHLNNKFFDVSDKKLNRDNILLPYYELRLHLNKMGIEINTIDMYSDLKEIDYVLFFRLDYKYLRKCLNLNLENRLIYFAWEPEVVEKNHSVLGLRKLRNYFKYIMTWNDDIIDNVNFFKINYPYSFIKYINNYEHKSYKKLLTNISGYKFSNHPKELYSERLNVINYFEKTNNQIDFEFYGAGWPPTQFKNYGGRIENKFQTYGNFKFALCFENMTDINGYITEKIFDCFISNVVPIYYGANNIDHYIPKECYIDYNNFNSIDDMVKELNEMSDSQYNKYIENINEFITSRRTFLFTSQYFSECLIKVFEYNNSAKRFKVKPLYRFIVNLSGVLVSMKRRFKSIRAILK